MRSIDVSGRCAAPSCDSTLPSSPESSSPRLLARVRSSSAFSSTRASSSSLASSPGNSRASSISLATRRQRRDLASHRAQLGVRAAHRRGLRLRATERVEYPALRLGVEKCLRIVLAVEVDELPPDLSEHRRRHRCAVDPGATTAIGGNLTFEHQRVVVDVDATLVRQRRDSLYLRDVEYSLDGRLVRARANEVGARALAEQKSERADDDRLAGARLARQDVESLGERKCQL